MKKVLLSAAISATLGLTALPSMAQNVDLRMSWWGGNGRHQVTLKALEEFHKQNPDINVKAEYTGWDGHLSRLTTQIAGGTEPDVMQTNWNWLPIFSKTGDGFYDLNKMKDVIDLSQFDPKELQTTTVNGKLNGIPISVTARSVSAAASAGSRSSTSFCGSATMSSVFAIAGISTGGRSETGRSSLDSHCGRSGSFLTSLKISASSL